MTKTKRDWRKASRQRQTIVGFRATAEERAIIEIDAAQAEMTISAYVRKVLLDAPVPRQSRRPPVEKKELSRLLGLTGKIGGNINQIAHRLNQLNQTGSYASMADSVPAITAVMEEVLTELKTIRADLRKALGYEP